MRLLLVEDDRAIGESLAKGLREAGYVVDWVRDGGAALTALRDNRGGYALALLDWHLPRQDGLAVLKAVHAAGRSLPVLMLTARRDPAHRPAGVETRTRALQRGTRGGERVPLVQGELTLDPVTHTLARGETKVTLSVRQFMLLRALMRRPDAVLSRSELEKRLYGERRAVESNAVEFLIHGIRKKLGSDIIDNVRGVGWRLGHCD